MVNTLNLNYPIDQNNLSTVPNLHIFKISFLPQSDKQPARVKIYSEYTNKSKVYSFGDGTKGDNTMTLALNILISLGFNILGRGNCENYYFIVSDTFKAHIQNRPNINSNPFF